MITTLKRIFSWVSLNLIPLPFNFTAYFVPKKKNVWVFGSWFGDKFSDNPKYLYLYVKEKHPEIRAIWLVKNKKIISNLREDDVEVYYCYSLKGFFYNIIAGVGISSMNCVTDLNRFCCSKRMKHIHLWHGQPLKKLVEDQQPEQGNLFIKLLILFMTLNRKVFLQSTIDLAIASSKEDQEIFRRCFTSNTIITGYPRNDVLSKPFNFVYIEELRQRKGVEKIILYLPTFRGNDKDSKHGLNIINSLDENADILNNFLKQRKTLLLIKLHHVDQKRIKALRQFSENIVFVDDPDIKGDVYPLLANADILITDYSSIYFDYLLTLKPIVFLPFDYDYYKKDDRGFYYDYYQVTPGPKVKNWPDALSYIEEYLDFPEKDRENRLKLCERFNKFNDGNSSERVYKEIIKLL